MARSAAKPLTDEEKAKKKAEREAEKASKFIELAQKRTSKALDAMAGLRALANKNSYSYTTIQVAAIMKALETEMTTIGNLFAPDAKSVAAGFDLAAAVEAIKPAAAVEAIKPAAAVEAIKPSEEKTDPKGSDS